MDFIKIAREMAEEAHKGQTRKHTGEPYITHPVAVAELIQGKGITDPISVCSALLHDTIEDCDMNLNEFSKLEPIGDRVAMTVVWLTDNKSLKGHRRLRKMATLERMRHAPRRVCIIKAADRLHNVRDMKVSDPDFYTKVYKWETEDLLWALLDGHPGLPLAQELKDELYGEGE